MRPDRGFLWTLFHRPKWLVYWWQKKPFLARWQAAYHKRKYQKATKP